MMHPVSHAQPRWAKPTLTTLLFLAIACGGTPEPEHEKEAAHPAREEIVLSTEAVRAAGIEVVSVSRETFHPHVIASGIIRPIASKNVTVRPLAGGRVVRVLADIGDRVRRGQILASIEGAEVSAAVARHRTAAAHEEAARRALERGEKLLEMKGISRAEVEIRRAEAESASAEAQAARQDLARLGLDPDDKSLADRPRAEFSVTAPMEGVVLSRSLSPGLLVGREAALFEIAELSRVWAIVDVYEKDLGQVRDQGEVEITTDTFPGSVFTGTIALIEPSLDEAGRTAHLRVALDNASGQLRPGMFITAAIPLRGATDAEATAVPSDAVQMITGLPAVFVEKGPGRFELRPVEVGREAHGMTEIRHGLKEQERVATKGAFVLKSELLKGTIEGEEH
ncbi:MAG TPA: efflux RND transporter periplasmic adaptor subunit [Candidatus Polarisedimenticolia bacterium]|nr:efflux RND transporter periplasmic adaptor subunit [Candidatus Polarisedimenticolia bacterium]